MTEVPHQNGDALAQAVTTKKVAHLVKTGFLRRRATRMAEEEQRLKIANIIGEESSFG